MLWSYTNPNVAAIAPAPPMPQSDIRAFLGPAVRYPEGLHEPECLSWFGECSSVVLG